MKWKSFKIKQTLYYSEPIGNIISQNATSFNDEPYISNGKITNANVGSDDGLITSIKLRYGDINGPFNGLPGYYFEGR